MTSIDEDVLGIRARRDQRTENWQRRLAQKALLGLTFVPEPPFQAEEFTGSEILSAGGGQPITDVHVVDARGRTLTRFPHKHGDRLFSRRARAAACVEGLNELLGEPAA